MSKLMCIELWDRWNKAVAGEFMEGFLCRVQI